jgi:hypothetical protein
MRETYGHASNIFTLRLKTNNYGGYNISSIRGEYYPPEIMFLAVKILGTKTPEKPDAKFIDPNQKTIILSQRASVCSQQKRHILESSLKTN